MKRVTVPRGKPRKAAHLVSCLTLGWLALAQAAAAQPLLRADVPEPPNNLRAESTLIRIIQDGYDRLAHFASMDGEPLEFFVDDFVTVRSEEFDTVYWADMVTPPGGEVVDVARERYEDASGRVLGVRYVPRWDRIDHYVISPEGRKATALKLNEIVGLAAEADEVLKAVTSATSFKVTLRFREHSRSYRAMFLWVDPEPAKSGELEFRVMDHVVQGLSESYGDPLEAAMSKKEMVSMRKAEARRNQMREERRKLAGGCVEDDAGGRVDHNGLYDDTEHVNGGHGPYMSVRFECPCTEGCTQECNPDPYFVDCQEFGDTTRCHRLSPPGFNVSYGFAQLGGSPPGCKAAIACAWKACSVGCFCGDPTVSVGVSGQGGSANFSYSWSPSSTKISFDVSHTCAPCEEVEPEPKTPILFNLDRRGFDLTSFAEGVEFDLDADGIPEHVSWTSAESRGRSMTERSSSATSPSSRLLPSPMATRLSQNSISCKTVGTAMELSTRPMRSFPTFCSGSTAITTGFPSRPRSAHSPITVSRRLVSPTVNRGAATSTEIYFAMRAA